MLNTQAAISTITAIKITIKTTDKVSESSAESVLTLSIGDGVRTLINTDSGGEGVFVLATQQGQVAPQRPELLGKQLAELEPKKHSTWSVDSTATVVVDGPGVGLGPGSGVPAIDNDVIANSVVVQGMEGP